MMVVKRRAKWDKESLKKPEARQQVGKHFESRIKEMMSKLVAWEEVVNP